MTMSQKDACRVCACFCIIHLLFIIISIAYFCWMLKNGYYYYLMLLISLTESITFAENVMKTIWFSKRYCLSHVLHITAKVNRKPEWLQIVTKRMMGTFWWDEKYEYLNFECASHYYYYYIIQSYMPVMNQ